MFTEYKILSGCLRRTASELRRHVSLNNDIKEIETKEEWFSFIFSNKTEPMRYSTSGESFQTYIHLCLKHTEYNCIAAKPLRVIHIMCHTCLYNKARVQDYNQM